jgi:general secretion pathway protein J
MSSDVAESGISPSSPRATAGFTLVELLLGLSLMGLLAVMLFGGFRFGLRAWEVGGMRIERQSEAELVQNLLQRQLGEAYSLADPNPQTAAAAIATFQGTQDSLSFVAPLPTQAGVGGLYRFGLGIVTNGGERRLVLAWQVFRPDRPPRPTVDDNSKSVLLHGIEGIDLAYFGRRQAGAAAQWQSDWDDRHGLPELIRLRVTFPGGDSRAWPDLFVAPKLRGPAT